MLQPDAEHVPLAGALPLRCRCLQSKNSVFQCYILPPNGRQLNFQKEKITGVHRLQAWQRPPEDIIKLNIDGAFEASTGRQDVVVGDVSNGMQQATLFLLLQVLSLMHLKRYRVQTEA